MGGRHGTGILVLGLASGIVSFASGGCDPSGTLVLVPSPVTSSRATVTPPPSTASGQPSFIRPTPGPSPTFLVHEVRAGETLTSIARLYGTTARSIAYWNRDRYPSLDPDSPTYEPDRIVVGWTLALIPTEVVDEDELPEPTATPSPASSAGSASPDHGASPS